MESISAKGNGVVLPIEHHHHRHQQLQKVKARFGFFQMPLHYPRYTRANYEKMPEWKVDYLLREYGLPVVGDLTYKREFAMGAFLWPSHSKVRNVLEGRK